MLLAEVARRGRHDRALRHNELASRLNGEPDVLLADEVERRAARQPGSDVRV